MKIERFTKVVSVISPMIQYDIRKPCQSISAFSKLHPIHKLTHSMKNKHKFYRKNFSNSFRRDFLENINFCFFSVVFLSIY